MEFMQLFEGITVTLTCFAVAWLVKEVVSLRNKSIELEVEIVAIKNRCHERLATLISMDAKLDEVVKAVARIEGKLNGGNKNG